MISFRGPSTRVYQSNLNILLSKQPMRKYLGAATLVCHINITVEGVQKLLDKLNPYKAPGPGTYSPEARLLQSPATYSRFPLEQVLFLMTGS